jgi:hypothetical protein
MAYDINYPGLQRRAATYVDRILKGAKPSDLPVQQPRDRVLSPRAADPRVSRRSAKGSRGAVMGFDSIALSWQALGTGRAERFVQASLNQSPHWSHAFLEIAIIQSV